MVEYLLSIFNSTELIALGIKNASESTIFERILEFVSENSLIIGITFMLVFLLGLLFMVVQKCFQDCCARTFEWLTTKVKEAFGEWWEKTKALLFTVAKETFLILLRRDLYIKLERVKVKMDSLHNKLKNADFRADKHDDNNAKKSVGKLVNIIYNFETAYDRYQLLQEMTPETPEYSSNTWPCWVFVLKKLWLLKLNFLILITKISLAFSVAKVNQELANSNSHHQGVVKDESRQQHQTPPRPAQDYDLDGLQSSTEKLIKMLKARNKRQFIVVTGEAGIGKTTLVEKVYLDSEVRSYFQLRAFVTVSQTYDQKHILKAIFDQLKAYDDPSLIKIEDKIRNHLQTSKKSYIVVLDDVWGNDDKFWECIYKAFPYNEKGSGILMTMRGLESNVPRQRITTLGGITFHVHPLSDYDAQLLFCKKAFPSDNGKCPPALSYLLPTILLKCENNPLLIGVVAAILLNCKEITAPSWQAVIDDLGYAFSKDTAYERIKSILLYSYHDLSYELQQCFLYFGMFPEDSQIYFHTLVHIWVAEGFIRPWIGTNYTLEEIAENHLNDLICRGLVTLGYKTKKSLRVMLELREKFVRVHGVFHDIILQKLKDLEFCHVLSWNSRSVLSFKNETFPNFPKTSIICLQRVLLLEHYEKDNFPEVVASMRNLRFLSLTHHKIKEIPEFICKLLNLETLEIKHSSYCELPKEMSMLKKLRHLLLSREVRIPKGVLRSLTALQTLDEIEGERDQYIMEELKHLTQLRRLAIVNVDKNYDRLFSEALQEMLELRFLSMCWSNISPRRDTDSYHNRSPPKKLESIVLWGDIGRDSLSGWIKEVKELRSLSLHLTRSEKRINIRDTKKTTEELIAALKPLKKLEHLYLRTEGIEQLDFGPDGFDGLQYLRVRDFDLKSITGSLPALLELDLRVMYRGTKLNLPDHLKKVVVIRCYDVNTKDDVL